MTDSFGVVARLIMLAFVPAMLLIPLLFAALTRSRAVEESARALVRSRMIVLCLATLIALCAWLGALLAGANLRSSTMDMAARFAWVMFFPLWFVFAMQVLRAKNPAWAGSDLAGDGSVRSASLVNRSRKNPISRRHWIFVAIVCAALMAAIAARGFAPSVSDEAARSRWMFMIAGYAFMLLVTAVALPWGLRLALREPEPMDASGSPELARMYDEYRDAKIRCLFWLLGAAMPFFIGACTALAAWIESDLLGAWLGAVGGCAIGIGGAWIGTALGLRRMRITEFKATLEKNGVTTT